MLKAIGEVAGEIWSYFNSNGNDPVSLTVLAKKIGRKKEEVVYGTGWLAREGKLDFDDSKATVKVSLAK